MCIRLHLNTMSLILNTHPIHEFSASCVIQQYPPRRRMISVTYPKPLQASQETLQRSACCRRHGCCRRARCFHIGVGRYSQDRALGNSTTENNYSRIFPLFHKLSHLRVKGNFE